MGYFLELTSTSINAELFILNFKYIGILLIPAFGIMFISELTERKLKKNKKVSLILFSIVLWLLVITNPFHHLIYKSIQLAIDEFSILQTVRGPVFYLIVAYYVLFIIYSIITLLKAYYSTSNTRRRKSLYFLAVVFQIAWIPIIIILAGLDKLIDPVHITITVMCGFFIINEQKNNMFEFDIKRWKATFYNFYQPAILISKEREILCCNNYANEILNEQTESIEEVIKKLENSNQNNKPISFYINSLKKWFNVKASDYNIKNSYTAYLLIDVTEYNLYHERIKTSEQNYRTFFETIEDIIIIGNSEGNIRYVNSAASKKLGYSTEEFKKKNILDVHSKNNRKEAEIIFKDMFEGKRNTCPLPLETKSGDTLSAETRIWFGEWDGEECVFGISKDISKEQEALQKFNKIFDNNPSLMALSEFPERQFIDVNTAFINSIGYTKDEVIGKTASEMGLFIMPDMQKTLSKKLNKYGTISNFELKVKTKSGNILDGLFSGEIIISQGKKYFLTVMNDVTELKLAEEEKIRQSQLIISLLDSMPDLIFYKDINCVYLGCNPQFAKFVGKSRNEIIGKTDFELFDLEIAKFFRHNDLEMFKIAKSRRNEERLVFPDGKEILADTLKTPYYDSNGNIIGIIGISRDITKNKKSEEKITYLSYHDQLTGLYNRRYYEDELDRINSIKDSPLTLIMADVNGLKLTNDAFGHKAGDLILQKVANILKNESRIEDVVARIGGDEFVLLLPESNPEIAEKIIDRINKAVENEKIEYGILSISIGFAIKNNSTEDIDEIFKKAEDEMYRHKLSDSLSMRHKTIELILNTLYEKNNREMIHSTRVGDICEAIANKMNFDKDGINQIRLAGLMHDIGKIGIEEKILNTAKELNADEWFMVKRHVEIGYRILSSVNEFSQIASFVLAHHERWDGEGYPKGLKGEKIPIQSRIIAIADSYDAMMSDRPYRKAREEDEVINELRNCSGTQFDPEIVEIFVNKILLKK